MCQVEEQIRNENERKTTMTNDFLKVNQEDHEDLKKLKQFSQKAIDEGNFEDLAFIKLISATSVIEALKPSLDFENDKEKVKLLSDFLHSIYINHTEIPSCMKRLIL